MNDADHCRALRRHGLPRREVFELRWPDQMPQQGERYRLLAGDEPSEADEIIHESYRLTLDTVMGYYDRVVAEIQNVCGVYHYEQTVYEYPKDFRSRPPYRVEGTANSYAAARAELDDRIRMAEEVVVERAALEYPAEF